MTSLEIEAFLTVQRTGSITKAAELLYISQSSLSTRLRTLERELGFSLFARGRGTRSMTLTPDGRRLLPLAQQYRDLENRMLALGRDATKDRALRISSLDSVGNYLLPAAYQRFARLWPDIRLEIHDLTTADAIQAIVRNELDIAFSTLSQSTEHITTVPFLSEPMSFLCATGSDYPDPVPLKALSPAREVYSSWCADIDQWHRSVFGADAEPQVRLELMSQIRLFVSQPGTWAVVPHSVAEALGKTPDLRCSRTDFSIPDRRLYILCNRKTRESEPVCRFLDCLRCVQQEQGTPGLLL